MPQDPDRYAKASLESLRLSMWCKEHRTVMFFCEHRHEAAAGSKR